MGQVFHGCATTTHAVQAALQRSKAPLKDLAAQHGLNPKTVAKWRKRAFVQDAAMGPKKPRSTVLTAEEEAVVVAFRRHTLLPLDDCLFALQATIPHLTRSSLHRCLQRHGISGLPEVGVSTGPDWRSSRVVGGDALHREPSEQGDGFSASNRMKRAPSPFTRLSLTKLPRLPCIMWTSWIPSSGEKPNVSSAPRSAKCSPRMTWSRRSITKPTQRFGLLLRVPCEKHVVSVAERLKVYRHDASQRTPRADKLPLTGCYPCRHPRSRVSESASAQVSSKERPSSRRRYTAPTTASSRRGISRSWRNRPDSIPAWIISVERRRKGSEKCSRNCVRTSGSI